MPLLRAQVSSWMASVDAAGGPEQDDVSGIPYPEIDPALVLETERALTISYLLGMHHASPEAAADFADDERTVAAIPFDEAVTYMKTRVPLTKKEWVALEPELRFRSFTVAALATPDAIEKAKGMLISALEEGKSKSEFWKETRVFEEAGLTHAAPLYWENVYRTNIQSAYNTGRAAEYMRSNPEYIEFIGIDDGRQSEVCYALSHPAVQLPASHPFWKSHWPPLHFKCRSTTRGMYPEEVDALREADPTWTPSDADTITTPETAAGFGGNPLDSGSFYKMTPSMKARAEEYGLLEKIEKFASSLGIERRNIEIIGAEVKPPKITKAAPTTRKKPAVAPAEEISFSTIQDEKLKSLAQKAFKNAPDEVRAIVAAHTDDFSYRFAPKRGKAYYSPPTETIFMRRSAGPDVFAHEFGHGIDIKTLSIYSQSDEFLTAFNADLGALIDDNTGAILEMGKKLKQDIIDKGWADLPPVSDLFSGLTYGRIEGLWGHPKYYWSKQGKREAEVFADLFAVKASGETALWNELTSYTPRLCKAVESALVRR